MINLHYDVPIPMLGRSTLWSTSPNLPQFTEEGGCRPISIGDAMRRIDELERRVKELEQG